MSHHVAYLVKFVGVGESQGPVLGDSFRKMIISPRTRFSRL